MLRKLPAYLISYCTCAKEYLSHTLQQAITTQRRVPRSRPLHLCCERLHLTPNWFLLNLLISDLCVGVVNFPLGVTCAFHVQCKRELVLSFINTFLNASATNLCLMTLDRYFAVVWPFRYQAFMTKLRIVISVMISWFIAITISLGYIWAIDQGHGQYYVIFHMITLEVAPAVLLTSAYTHMLIIGRRHLKRVTHMMSQLNFNYGGKSCSYHSNERSAVKVIGAVTLLFVLCNSLSVYLIFQMVIFPSEVPDVLIFISTILVYLNSAVNFVTYALFKSDIRREIRHMFCSRSIRTYEERYAATDGPLRLSFMSSQKTRDSAES